MNKKMMKSSLLGIGAFVAVVSLSGCFGSTTSPAETESDASTQKNDTMIEEKTTQRTEDEKMMEDEKMIEVPMDITDIAVGSPDHTTLVVALGAGDLVDTLKGPGPFTVFAPTNDAFDALPAGTVDSLLLPENKDQLVGVLTYHVVPAKVMSTDVVQTIADNGGMYDVKTVAGGTLTLKNNNGVVTITDEMGNTANVTTVDLEGSNGVVHVIDAVLLPQS